ncbi:MAG: hypothetical protein NT009_01435 [Proteobacteria bacterium]|nr:hypothetical protein [Pseudomonadota bacterium]
MALNKIDLEEGRGKKAAVEKALKRKKVKTFPISALTGEGIEELSVYLLNMVKKDSTELRD